MQSNACEESFFKKKKINHCLTLVPKLTLPKNAEGNIIYFDAFKVGLDVWLCRMVKWLLMHNTS